MIEAVIRRQEYFQLIIDSHLRWRRETNDEKLKLFHLALADALERVVEQYRALLDELRQPH